MRVLLLFRGAPGCGKSTYIHENGLDSYTLSADTIRMQYSSPIQTKNGSVQISAKNDSVVWSLLFQMLELRMQSGCFTVIDATNSKTEEMNRYKALARQYRYRIYLIDMTDLPIEDCKRRNASRAPLKQVPEEAIDKMYARFKTQKVPGGIKVLKPENALAEISYKPSDMNSYRKVYAVGDIHGCYTALQDMLGELGGLQDDCLYIFCGDYIDRGMENADVVKFLLSVKDKPNIVLLEGNHERWLYCWSHDKKTPSKEFELRTSRQLDDSGLDKKEVSRLYQRLNQCSYFSFRGAMYFICHGGIAGMQQDQQLGLITIPTFQMIHGVGGYNDLPDVVEAWNKIGMVQIAGHRNIQNYNILTPHSNYVNLEGSVEFGGSLRAIEIDSDGNLISHSVKNHKFYKPEEQPIVETKEDSVYQLVKDLRRERNVREKRFGCLSAFNFTSEAFRRSSWNELTTVARGLFINTEDHTIVARGYEKFFRIDELARVYHYPHSNLDYLKDKLKFPVNVYLKENGYLGLLCYDPEIDDLRFCTKGSISGDYADYFRQLFQKNVCETGSTRWNEIKQYLKENNCTMLFEVIDQQFDPHIIEYDTPHLVLLDVVYNEIAFRKIPYTAWIGDDLIGISKRFDLNLKKYVNQFMDWQKFYDFYIKASAPGYVYDGHFIEGFVFEDSAGFMTKLKTDYYSFWKHMRSVADGVRRFGSIKSTGQLTDAQSNLFYGFLRDKYTNDEAFRDRHNENGYDIISLRKAFLSSQEGTQ